MKRQEEVTKVLVSYSSEWFINVFTSVYLITLPLKCGGQEQMYKFTYVLDCKLDYYDTIYLYATELRLNLCLSIVLWIPDVSINYALYDIVWASCANQAVTPFCDIVDKINIFLFIVSWS